MLEQYTTLENLGELLKANIKYDLQFNPNKFNFVETKTELERILGHKIEKSINRKITKDDKL